jgi:hypothetical protein
MKCTADVKTLPLKLIAIIALSLIPYRKYLFIDRREGYFSAGDPNEER